MSCLQHMRRCKRELYRTMVESLMRIIERKRHDVAAWESANILQHLRFDFWLWSRRYRNVAYLVEDTAMLFAANEPDVPEELGEGAIGHFQKILGYLHAAAKKEWGLREVAEEVCQKATARVPYGI